MTFKNSSHATTKQVAYEYDTLDRRVRKRVDTDGNSSWDRGEQYVYDGAHIALQFDDGGSLERRNLFGPAVDQILASEFTGSPNETNWYIADHLGTVRDVYSYDNSTDTLTSEGHIEYDSFGNIVSGSAAATDAHFAYTGREWDADAELFYYRHRWYDANLGQFISQDPIGFAAGDANTTRYVANDVLRWSDPSGLEGILSNGWNNVAYPTLEGAVQAHVTLLKYGNVIGHGYMLWNNEHPTQIWYSHVSSEGLVYGSANMAGDAAWGVVEISGPYQVRAIECWSVGLIIALVSKE